MSEIAERYARLSSAFAACSSAWSAAGSARAVVQADLDDPPSGRSPGADER